ncbi:MAG TPA: tetratricopeptide repeat protein [Steroidobacteraceae bacterium]
MRLTDQFGNPVSSRNRAAVELYDRAVTQLNLFRIDPLATIDAAIEEDPTFVAAHCFKAALLCTTSERGAEPTIAAALEAAERNIGHATDRERMHLNAARAWLSRDFAGAVKLWGDIVAEYPRDLHALQVAHLLDFFLGYSTMLRDRPAQVLPAWGKDERGRGIILGMYSFGLEECGDYARAQATGLQALDLDPSDAWAAHGVAHVLEMQGRASEGIEFLQSTHRNWSEGNFFAYHNWWHLALFYLDAENHPAALAVYDTRIRPTPSRIAMEMVDASALLWRLRLRSVDVGDRWQELAESWEIFGEDGYYTFNDVHALMAFLATGREDQVRRIMRSLEATAQNRDTNGMMAREVALPMARALVAFERRDYDVAIDELQRVRAHAHRFGGSHAQRDLLQLTVTEAAIRAGRRSLARALAQERLALKPESPFNRRLHRTADLCDASRAA